MGVAACDVACCTHLLGVDVDEVSGPQEVIAYEVADRPRVIHAQPSHCHIRKTHLRSFSSRHQHERDRAWWLLWNYIWTIDLFSSSGPGKLDWYKFGGAVSEPLWLERSAAAKEQQMGGS